MATDELQSVRDKQAKSRDCNALRDTSADAAL